MRDNHSGYTEILDAYERDGFHFGVVRVEVSGEFASFEFGLERSAYTALKRVLQLRPFADMPGLRYRYFFTGTYTRKKLDEEPVTVWVRVEQGTTTKNFEFDWPTSLASNMVWFNSLQSFSEAAQLRRVGD